MLPGHLGAGGRTDVNRSGADCGADNPVYFARPLTVKYLEDQLTDTITTGGACVLRCFPHEWSVLIDRKRSGDWAYAGRFKERPSPQQLEEAVRTDMTSQRNEGWAAEAEAAESTLDVEVLPPLPDAWEDPEWPAHKASPPVFSRSQGSASWRPAHKALHRSPTGLT